MSKNMQCASFASNAGIKQQRQRRNNRERHTIYVYSYIYIQLTLSFTAAPTLRKCGLIVKVWKSL